MIWTQSNNYQVINAADEIIMLKIIMNNNATSVKLPIDCLRNVDTNEL